MTYDENSAPMSTRAGRNIVPQTYLRGGSRASSRERVDSAKRRGDYTPTMMAVRRNSATRAGIPHTGSAKNLRNALEEITTKIHNNYLA